MQKDFLINFSFFLKAFFSIHSFSLSHSSNLFILIFAKINQFLLSKSTETKIQFCNPNHFTELPTVKQTDTKTYRLV